MSTFYCRKYSLGDLRSRYDKYVSFAQHSFSHGHVKRCINAIEAASLLQYHIMDCYTDCRLNSLLKKISISLYPLSNHLQLDTTVIFYDSFSWDNHGLTQQYLDALFYTYGERVVYVYEKTMYKNDSILRFLSDNKIKSFCVEGKNEIEKASMVFKIVEFIKPSIALFHVSPYSIAPFLAFYPFPCIIKYNINLTDHSFWLGGSDFFNYNIEFRHYGAQISIEKRGFVANQLIMLPYYPWVEKTIFNGFPSQTKGRIKIFSGGAYYKIEGGDGMFYEMIKEILKSNPEAVFLFAGTGNSCNFEKFISNNHLENRVFLLGHRNDINEVFKNSDIFLSTYPNIGGLMSQYAAVNGLPILAYGNKDIESIVCTKTFLNFVSKDMPSLLAEATKLIKNSYYRQERGKIFKSLCVNQDDFRNSFNMWFVDSKKSILSYKEKIEYKLIAKESIKRYNDMSMGCIQDARLFIKCPYVVSLKMILNLITGIPVYINRYKQRRKIG